MSLQDLADTVVEVLNDPPLELQSVKAFRPEFALVEMANEKIVVVPARLDKSQRQTRGGLRERENIIQIGVGRRLDKNEGVVEETVIATAQSIFDYFEEIDGVTGDTSNIQYPLIDCTFTPYYDYDTLKKTDMILSIVELRFREYKQYGS